MSKKVDLRLSLFLPFFSSIFFILLGCFSMIIFGYSQWRGYLFLNLAFYIPLILLIVISTYIIIHFMRGENIKGLFEGIIIVLVLVLLTLAGIIVLGFQGYGALIK